MAWDEEARRVAINVIGTVESNLTYDAINYSDAITVGFAQWYGTRAAGLLNQLREAEVSLVPWGGFDTSATNHPYTSEGQWHRVIDRASAPPGHTAYMETTVSSSSAGRTWPAEMWIPVEEGRTYRLSYWLWTDAPTDNLAVGFLPLWVRADGTEFNNSFSWGTIFRPDVRTPPASGQWTQYSELITAPASSTGSPHVWWKTRVFRYQAGHASFGADGSATVGERWRLGGVRVVDVDAPSAWVGVTDRLNNALENNAENNASFWTNFYLHRADGQSLSGPLTSTTGVKIQNEQFLVDLESYNTAAANRGLNRETHTPEFIYYAQLYHQSPRYANQVLTQAGANPTLARLHSLAGNHSWYSQFRSRLNTAKRIIDEWDDELPEQFDPSEPKEGGDQSADNPITETAGIVDSVQLVGGQLHVRTRSGLVVCEPTPTSALWVPNRGVGAGPTIPPPTDPGEEDIPGPVEPPTGAEATAMALRQFLLDRVGWYPYSQTHPKRLSPAQGDPTDCSGLMYFAYRSVVGSSITTSNFGAWTVAQNERGRNIRSFQGSIVPESLLQVGDLVFYSRDSLRVRHVEMYIGNGQLIGWGGVGRDRGPYVKTSYTGYYKSFDSGTVWSSARRHLPDF